MKIDHVGLQLKRSIKQSMNLKSSVLCLMM